jgi:HK97 family phage major capsid protein
MKIKTFDDFKQRCLERFGQKAEMRELEGGAFGVSLATPEKRTGEKAMRFPGAIEIVPPAAESGRRAESDNNVIFSFSSETPVLNWWGEPEILSHHSEDADMSRFAEVGACLYNHNHDQITGKPVRVWIENGKGYCEEEFGTTEIALKAKHEVLVDGSNRGISVGFLVREWVFLTDENTFFRGIRGTADGVWVASKWEALEASHTPVPADPSVGVGRSLTDEPGQGGPERKPEPAARKTEDKPNIQTTEKNMKDQKADAELQRRSDITDLAAIQRDKISDIDERAQRAVRDGVSLDSFRREILDCYTDGTAKLPQPASLSKQEQRDLNGYSFSKAIVEQAEGRLSGLELELHQEGAKEAKDCGVAVRGLSIPASVLQTRDLTVGTEGADVVATGITGFIDLLRNKMIVQQLGAQTLTGLTGDIQIPKLTAGATAAWEGENDAGSEQTQTLGQLALSPNRVGCYTDISKQLLIQSSIDVEMMVRNDLATAIALAIDAAAINGSGSGNQPEGILNVSGIGSVAGGTNGLAPAWSHIVDLESEVAIDNADVGALSYLTNAAVRGALKQTAKVSSTDSVMIWGNGATPVNGYSCGVSNQVPSDLDKGTSAGVCSAIIFGNWNDLIVAQWGGLDLVVDPYTLATTNLLRIVANTYADVGVRHAESFAAMQDALTA